MAASTRGLLLLLLTLSSTLGLEMEQSTYNVGAQEGGRARLSCKVASDEFLDSCTFTR